jgi:multisubunit Na+/H+ antiporter MnhB subunit
MKKPKRNNKVVFLILIGLMALNALVILILPDFGKVHAIVLGISLIILIIALILFYNDNGLDYS